MIERSTKNLIDITLYRYEIREQSYRKINDWSTLLVKRKQDFIVRAILRWLSYVGRRADALALRAEERRDKLRKAAVSCKEALTRRYLNGATRLRRP